MIFFAKEVLWLLGTMAIVSLCVALSIRWGQKVIVGIIVACIVSANILATKIISLFWFTVPAGVIVYAVVFLLTDTLSEYYGEESAFQAVTIGFIANIIYFISVFVAVRWPSAFGPEADQAFRETLSLSSRITFASLVTYLVSQYHDVWAYSFWGNYTDGKYLWLRNNASTVVSQLIDTVLFITIAFIGVRNIVPLIIGQFFVKLIIAIVDTGFLYAVGGIFEMYGISSVYAAKSKNTN